MEDWDNILANYARTGTFHGKGQTAEDAYFEFFGAEPTRRVVMPLSLQVMRTITAHLSFSVLIRQLSMLPVMRRLSRRRSQC